MNRLPPRLPVLITVLLSLAMAWHGPIAQLPHYHDFADQSMFAGVPHAGDVLSNAGFALVALWGLVRLWPRRAHPLLAQAWPGYALFLCALLLTSAGSAFYHLAPDDARLLWDRLPIALACAGLLAGSRADNVPGTRCAIDTALLAMAATASACWWTLTQDLRPYLLLQALPLVVIPVWQQVHRAPKAERLAFGAALLLYCAAKAAELCDHGIYAALHIVSGHTLKHLLATLAAAFIVCRLARRTAPPVLEQDDDHRSRDDQRAAERHLPGQALAGKDDAKHDRHRHAQLVDGRDLADGAQLQRTVVAQPGQAGGDARQDQEQPA
jgi:hypothetical protein